MVMPLLVTNTWYFRVFFDLWLPSSIVSQDSYSIPNCQQMERIPPIICFEFFPPFPIPIHPFQIKVFIHYFQARFCKDLLRGHHAFRLFSPKHRNLTSHASHSSTRKTFSHFCCAQAEMEISCPGFQSAVPTFPFSAVTIASRELLFPWDVSSWSLWASAPSQAVFRSSSQLFSRALHPFCSPIRPALMLPLFYISVFLGTGNPVCLFIPLCTLAVSRARSECLEAREHTSLPRAGSVGA